VKGQRPVTGKTKDVAKSGGGKIVKERSRQKGVIAALPSN